MSDAFWQMVGVAFTASMPVVILLLQQNRTARKAQREARESRAKLMEEMGKTQQFVASMTQPIDK